MDISQTLQPNSDQLDAVELIGGPRTFTIASVSAGDADQPVNVHFTDFPRPWRPAKSMRRVLAFCWGTDASLWVGRRVELFFDPEVTFGKDKPGGTRISRLSHIDKRKSIPLLVTRGKSAIFTVEPLKDDAPTQPAPDLTKMFAALNDAGLGDKDAALTYISAHIGRQVASSKELTRDEAAKVTADLEAMLGPDDQDDAAPTLDGEPA